MTKLMTIKVQKVVLLLYFLAHNIEGFKSRSNGGSFPLVASDESDDGDADGETVLSSGARYLPMAGSEGGGILADFLASSEEASEEADDSDSPSTKEIFSAEKVHRNPAPGENGIKMDKEHVRQQVEELLAQEEAKRLRLLAESNKNKTINDSLDLDHINGSPKNHDVLIGVKDHSIYVLNYNSTFDKKGGNRGSSASAQKNGESLTLSTMILLYIVSVIVLRE